MADTCKRVADIEAGKIGVEPLRYGLGQASQFNRMTHDVENAAAFQPREIPPH